MLLQTKIKRKVHRGGWNSSVANALPRTLWISMCPWLRKDKYNSDINKYHVEIDEEDESVDEDLERYVKTSTKVSPCVSVCVLILVHFTVVPCLLFENICGCSARNYNINQRVHLYFCVLCTCRCIYCMSDLSYHARPTILPTIYTVSKTQNVNMNGSYLYIFNLSNHNSLMIHWPQLSWLVYTGYPHWVWQAANAPVKFKKLNPKRTREDLVPAEGSEPEEDENSPQDAEPVTGIQEWMPKTLGLVLYIISNIIRIHINIWYLYICMHSFELYRTNQSKSCCVRH